MKMPIWISTLSVIFLIIILALTVNHSLEKDMARQFGKQQLVIAEGIASRIEDLIADIEKSARLFSWLSSDRSIAPDTIQDIMQSLYGDLPMTLAAKIDEKGNVQTIFPTHEGGMVNGDLIREIRKIKKPHIYHVDLPGGAKDGTTTSSTILTIPTQDGGIIITALSLDKITARFTAPDIEGVNSNLWMVDDMGFLIIHPRGEVIGQTVQSIGAGTAAEKDTLKAVFMEGKAGYGTFKLRDEGGHGERRIIAYAPVREKENLISVAITTPYGSVIALLRKAFINIMIGTIALIIVVMIAAVSIAYAGVRQLRLKEELKYFKERKELQDRLIREHQTLEGILEGSPTPTFVLNRDHTILYWNKACSKLTGYDAADMVGTEKHYLPFYEEERPGMAHHIINGDIEGMKQYYSDKGLKEVDIIEGAYAARDFFKNLGGKSRYLYILAAPIYDDSGNIIAAIETLQDISEEVILANDLKEYTDSLQDELGVNIRLKNEIEELNVYLKSMIRSLPAKLFDIGSDGIINYASLELEKSRQDKPVEMKGKHFLEVIDPENRDFMIAKWEELQKGIHTPYELEATARDGSKRHLLLTSHPMKGTDRFLFVQRDITEFKNLEKRFYESQKLAAVGQLSAGIAHEVRNPLSSIKMSLQILEKRMQPLGNNLKRFKIAMREVDHLEKLVNDVLIYARPAAPAMKRSDIRNILEHALEMTEKAQAEKHIHVHLQFDEDAPLIMADRAMLEHVFINTCHNAIDAMDDEGTLRISTKFVNNERPLVIVEISDNGCGIDAEDLPHLFNPFFTRKKYGTGLGLTQVKKIMDLHQGSIDISSKTDEGTTVTVTIPVNQEEGTSKHTSRRE